MPQESIHGPILFSIYVNDLTHALGPERSFVDDTKLYISFLAHWAGDVNVDLPHIRDWCFESRFLLNPDKTKLIAYGSRH